MEREEAEQEELGVAMVMLSLAGAMRKAVKVAELAGVAEPVCEGEACDTEMGGF